MGMLGSSSGDKKAPTDHFAYRSAILRLLKHMDETERLPPSKLAVRQLRRIEKLLIHARRTTPCYRRRLAPLGRIKPGTLTMRALQRIPVLTRTDVQGYGSDVFSTYVAKSEGRPIDVITSGSTGRPIKVKATRVMGLFLAAQNIRYHRWHGRNFDGTVACIRNLSGALARQAHSGRGAIWAPRGFGTGQIHFFDITRPIVDQFAWLTERDPSYLLTFPSNLKALLDHSSGTSVKPSRLQQAATMSETLPPGLRNYCERVWGVTVTDAYSAEEVDMIAIQCPDYPHYHVQAERLLVEVLDDNDRACGPGGIGRVIITDMYNYASPLIRYEIGDYAEVGGPCPCGRSLPVLKRIVGRSRNMLTLPSGDKIWPSFPEDKMTAVAPVRQFQVVQRDLTHFIAKIAVARPLSYAEEKGLRDYFVACLRNPFALELEYTDEIPRQANGKFEDFISTVG